MKRTLKRILGIVMALVALGAFLITVGEPTPECAHPFLTRYAACGVLLLELALAKRVWPEVWKEDEQQ